MANGINQTITINVDAHNISGAANDVSRLAKEWANLGTYIAEALSGLNTFSASVQNLSKFDPKKIKKSVDAAKTPQDGIFDLLDRESSKGAKHASTHQEYQEHIKALTELASVNAELVKVMKHMSPEEVGLKKSGHAIARENIALGWANLENRQDKFYKYSSNFAGGIASNLQRLNSRIMNKNGLFGILGRIGQREGANGTGFWSKAEFLGMDKATGKPMYGKLPKWNINNMFGGALAKATGGAGLNLGAMGALAPLAPVAAIGLLGKEFIKLGESAKKATGEIQSLKTQMSIVMGGTANAENIYAGVEKFALKSPFGLSTSADMASLLKQSGVNASELLQTLRMIGDTSSGNAEKMRRVANNYAQIQAIGKASMLDMRQFAYAGIPIYKEVADYLKVSQQELRKMISEGKVTANVIENVFKRMTSSGGVFENATERGSKTLMARTQNLADAVQIAQAQFGEWYMGFGAKGYNKGLGNFILNTKESLASELGESFKATNAFDNGRDALNLLSRIQGDTSKINSKIKDQNNFNDDVNARILDMQIKNAGGMEKIYADLATLAKQKGSKRGVKGYNLGADIISDEDKRFYEELVKRDRNDAMLSAAERGGIYGSLMTATTAGATATALPTAGASYLAPALAGAGIALFEGITRGLNKLGVTHIGKYNIGSAVDKYGWTSTDEELYARNMLDKSTTKEQWIKNYKEMQNDDTAVYLGYSISEVKQMLQTAVDLQDKINKQSVEGAKYFNGESLLKSLQDIGSAFKGEWKSSWQGKIDEQKKKEDEWKLYSDTYDKFAEYQDENNKLITKNIDTLTQLTNVLDSGFFNIEDSIDFTKMTESQSEALEKRISKVMELYSAEAGKVRRKSGGKFEELDALRLVAEANRITDISKRREMVTKRFSDFKNITNFALGEDMFKSAMRYLQNSFSMEDKAKMWWPMPLKDRIMGATFGFDPERMKTPESFGGVKYDKTPSGWLKYYHDTYGKRELSESMMLGMWQNRKDRYSKRKGYTFSEMTGAFVQESGNTMNWKKTQENLQRMAFGSKATTDSLAAFAKALDSQSDKYRQLAAKLGTQGENLELILKDGSLNQELASAINYSDVNFNGQKVTFDAESGKFMAGDKALSNEEVKTLNLTGVKLISMIDNLIDSNDKLANSVENRKSAVISGEKLADTFGDRTLFQALNGYNKYGADQKVYNAGKKYDINFDNWFGQVTMQKARVMSNSELTNLNKIMDEWLTIEQIGEKSRTLKEGTEFRTQKGVYNKVVIDVEEEDGSRHSEYRTIKNGKYVDRNEYNEEKRKYESTATSGMTPFDKAVQLLEWKNQIDENPFANQKDKEKIAKMLSGLGVDYENKTVLGDEWGDEKLNAAGLGVVAFAENLNTARDSVEKLGEAIRKTFTGAPLEALNNTMAKLGENIAKGVDNYEDMDKVIKDVGKSMMSNLAAAATQAGLSLISSGKISAGLALIAAGGMASFLGGLMSDTKDDDDDGKLQKLKDLKQDLADLLRQAREDAIYYENHLRHTNALGYNSQVGTTTKVNDAIITPQGNVITTHPEDYLIASKNPSGLVGKAAGSPIVNIAIENNSGKQISMKQESRENGSGGVDIVAVIEETVGNYVSSSRSDEAFAAREARIKGRTVVA